MPSYPTPAHPERVCWGCGEYCPADDLTCGKDTVRTSHPAELLGDDWQEWGAANGADAPDQITRSRVVEALRGGLDLEVGINIVAPGSCARLSRSKPDAEGCAAERREA